MCYVCKHGVWLVCLRLKMVERIYITERGEEFLDFSKEIDILRVMIDTLICEEMDVIGIRLPEKRRLYHLKRYKQLRKETEKLLK